MTLSQATIKEKFEEVFGQPAQLVVQAPGRVNLIGEHTDYNEGFVFPAAIDRAMSVAARPRTDGTIHVYSLEYNQHDQFEIADFEKISGEQKQWANYLRAVISTLLKRGYQLSGFDAALSGDVPQGAGLSSSAAFEVAVATVCNTIDNLGISPRDIALIAQQAENEFIGVQCGIMDQFISALGQPDCALLIDCRSLDYKAVPLKLTEHDASIVITNSGVRRGLVDSEYNLRRLQCSSGVEALTKLTGRPLTSLRDIALNEFEKYVPQIDPVVASRCRHVISENERVLKAVKALEESNLELFGELMNQAHASIRDDFAVSCAEVDLLVELTQAVPGVFGARMTGGGFGGCTVALVKNSAMDDLHSQIRHYEKATEKQAAVYVCKASAGSTVM